MAYLLSLSIISGYVLILHMVGLFTRTTNMLKRQFKYTEGRREAKLYQPPITNDLHFCYEFPGTNLCRLTLKHSP